MFTIKHEDANGNTSLIQAKWFTSERRSDGFTQFLAFNEHRGDYEATWCADENTAPSSDAIYVMNEKGATVSVHRFNQPSFGKCHAETLQSAREQVACL